MAADSIDFHDINQELMGYLDEGDLRLNSQGFHFKNRNTGKVVVVGPDELEEVYWQRLGNKPGIKLVTKNGIHHRFNGFKEADFNKISAFCKSNFNKAMEKQDFSVKGWNYGEANIKGQNMVFEIDQKLGFEVPLSNVSRCVGAKSEVIMEFHVNEDCPVQLMEMRLHMPQDPNEKTEENDILEEFISAVNSFIEVEAEQDQALVTLPQILCATPRGRYDIKVFQGHLSFHGKTHDYKIPYKTITRMFLLPHKDQRHMFLVLHINPPIRQGQTRYPFLVLEFAKDEFIEVEIALTEDQLKNQYKGKLESNMKGLLYEIVAKLFRVLVDSKILTPGNFRGASGTPAIACALRQASGYLYPMEKGFVYVHKPPMYIRFEEIDNVHFARSDVSTRSFDFEIVKKSGQSILFSSVGKEEYNKLFDHVQAKGLKIRNATRLNEKPSYKEDNFLNSDEELDPYKESLKRDVANRDKAAADGVSESDSEDDDYDLDEDLKKSKQNKESSEGSGTEPDEEFDSMSDESEVSDDMVEQAKKAKKADSEKPSSSKNEKSSSSSKPKEATGGGGGAKKSAQSANKRKKDPNAPKRNQTSFFLWQTANRANIKKPEDSVTDTAIRAGQMWKAMSEADKKPYEQKAKEDKERYEREMKEYLARPKPADESEDERSKSTKTTKKPSSSKPSSSKAATAAENTSPAKKAISKEFVEDDSDEDSSGNETKKKKTKLAKIQEETKKKAKETDSSAGEGAASSGKEDSSEESDISD